MDQIQDYLRLLRRVMAIIGKLALLEGKEQKKGNMSIAAGSSAFLSLSKNEEASPDET